MQNVPLPPHHQRIATHSQEEEADSEGGNPPMAQNWRKYSDIKTEENISTTKHSGYIASLP